MDSSFNDARSQLKNESLNKSLEAKYQSSRFLKSPEQQNRARNYTVNNPEQGSKYSPNLS